MIRSRLRLRPLKPLLLSSVFGAVLACGIPFVGTADAKDKGNENSQPILLNADQMTFDEQTGVVTARGNVEVAQGKRSVRADTITYNRKTKIVTATGNVRLVEPSGDILFSDYAELTEDLADAFVDNVRVLMTDNARLAGNEAERRGEQTTRISRGVYSPCDVCKEDPSIPPLWQLKAVRIVHDKEQKEIRYRDARLEMFGVPIVYTPYFSHPDATVKRRSGVLAPTYGRTQDLGFFVTGRYYADISPDQDATLELTPIFSGGAMAGGQYRKRFENGILQLDGSFAYGPMISESTGHRKGDAWRGAIAGSGLFEINDTWRWGFDAERASDRTYLSRYRRRSVDVLTSRAYVEGFRDRNYAAVDAYSFQDMRFNNSVREPFVAPDAVWSAYGDPGSLFGGRWAINSGVRSLYRKDGPNTLRFTMEPSWERRLTSSTGLVTTMHTALLIAAYGASDYVHPGDTTGNRTNERRYRIYPEADLTVRYPFVRYTESYSQTVEPIVQIKTSTNVKNSSRIPNEDSLDMEFDESNLFSPNRFNGQDRLESGTRLTYGGRTTFRNMSNSTASLFLGQSYRLTGSSDYPSGSGLVSRLSDVIGRVDVAYEPWFSANYGFRVNTNPFKVQRQSAGASVGNDLVRVSANYTLVNALRSSSSDIARSRTQSITGGLSGRISSHWTYSLGHQQALINDPGPRSSSGVLTYHDECFTFDTVLSRDYVKSGNALDNGVTAYFRLVFKNLGEVTTPAFSITALEPASQNLRQ